MYWYCRDVVIVSISASGCDGLLHTHPMPSTAANSRTVHGSCQHLTGCYAARSQTATTSPYPVPYTPCSHVRHLLMSRRGARTGEVVRELTYRMLTRYAHLPSSGAGMPRTVAHRCNDTNCPTLTKRPTSIPIAFSPLPDQRTHQTDSRGGLQAYQTPLT